jgi:hypothetical protein
MLNVIALSLMIVVDGSDSCYKFVLNLFGRDSKRLNSSCCYLKRRDCNLSGAFTSQYLVHLRNIRRVISLEYFQL